MAWHVTVVEVPIEPTADADGPYSVNEGSDIVLDASGSWDPNNDIVSYHWDFDPDDEDEYEDASGIAPTFTADSAGTFTVFLRVEDEDGASDTDSAVVTVSEVGAIADFNNDGSVNGGDLPFWEAGFGTPSGASLSDGDANRDGDVDGNDFLVWQLNVTPPPEPTADFNNNGSVDCGDLPFWQAGFGTPDGAILSDGDSDADGDIDGNDFLVWQRQLENPPGVAADAVGLAIQPASHPLLASEPARAASADIVWAEWNWLAGAASWLLPPQSTRSVRQSDPVPSRGNGEVLVGDIGREAYFSQIARIDHSTRTPPGDMAIWHRRTDADVAKQEAFVKGKELRLLVGSWYN